MKKNEVDDEVWRSTGKVAELNVSTPVDLNLIIQYGRYV